MVDVNFTTPEALASTLGNVSAYLNYFGAVLEATVIIFLTYKIIYKNNINFRSAYFSLYLTGLYVDEIAAVIWFVNNICLQYSNVYFFDADNIFFWYSTLFVGMWNTVLAFNRCTVLVLPLTQKKIWTPTKVQIFILFLLLYPFIVNGYTFSNLPCKSNPWRVGCEQFLLTSRYFGSFANIAQAVLSLILSTVAYVKMPKINAALKIEHRMLIHSVYHSILLTVYAASQTIEAYFHSNSDLRHYFTFLKAVSDTLYALYHYSSLVILLFISGVFRRQYFSFYYVDRCFKTKPNESVFVKSIGADRRSGNTRVSGGLLELANKSTDFNEIYSTRRLTH